MPRGKTAASAQGRLAPTDPQAALEAARLGTGDGSHGGAALLARSSCATVSAGREGRQRGGALGHLLRGRARAERGVESEFVSLWPESEAGWRHPGARALGSGASVPLHYQVTAAHRGGRAARRGSSAPAGSGPQGHWLTLVPKQTPCGPLVASLAPQSWCVPRRRGSLSLTSLLSPLIPSSPQQAQVPVPLLWGGPEGVSSPTEHVRLCTSPRLTLRHPCRQDGVNIQRSERSNSMMLNKVPFHAQSLFVFAF